MEQLMVWHVKAEVKNGKGTIKEVHVGTCKHKHEIGRILTTYKPPRLHELVKFEIFEAFIWN